MCENEFEIDYPDFIDLNKNPEIEEQILSGNFITAICPVCGKELKPEFPFQITDEKRDINCFFIPELDRGAYFLGKLEYPVGTPKRVAIGFRELVEKINIMRNKLDDRTIEILKFYLFHKAVSEKEDNNPSIIFKGLENRNLIFHITGLADDRLAKKELADEKLAVDKHTNEEHSNDKPKQKGVAVTRIAFETYTKAKNNLDKGKIEGIIKKIITPPYVSMNKLEWEKSF